jgi:Integrase zinc binding domain
LREGVLYCRFETADGKQIDWQLVFPRVERRQYIQFLHGNIGHLGRRRTMFAIQKRVYWPSWSADVRLVLKCCERCGKYRRGKLPRQTRLKPVEAGDVWETVAIDVIEPLPTSRNGHRFILTLQCLMSTWCVAIPLRHHTAVNIANALFQTFLVYRWPLRLLSDNAAEFEGEILRELCRLAGVNKIRSTFYQSRTNGVVERLNGTIQTMLAKRVKETQTDWHLHLPIAISAYRATIHEATNFSPNMLMFGREISTSGRPAVRTPGR